MTMLSTHSKGPLKFKCYIHGSLKLHVVGCLLTPPQWCIIELITLEESLSITTGRYDLAIATHTRKMHKKMFVVVHPEVLDND